MQNIPLNDLLTKFSLDQRPFEQRLDRFVIRWNMVDTTNNKSLRGSTKPPTDFDIRDINDAPWFIQNVTLPQYSFKKEIVQDGMLSKAFPVLDAQDTLEFTIQFNGETGDGLIQRFISWCLRKMIDENGFYVVGNERKIGDVAIDLINIHGNLTYTMHYENVYPLKVAEITLDHSNDALFNSTITFGADNMWIKFN